ncbi:Wadjet anti-phage system protein JetD domain-containing protein [Amycolatopsis sp. NPDC051371]|uniref:Wadjet anti-phage system protein JetD domain-containing protein n=1 Tax=Amycolatopsis sp. NPDC051371 TaxID=3155800 RepID=UPI00343A5BE2
MPNFVTIPAPATSGAPKRVVWHHKLSWVADVRVTPAQREHLRLVNAWLYEHDHEQLPVVPHRERSVKIFGNEKVLDKLMVTSLFGEGRLTLELVRARRVAPRFTFETVGPGDLLLVVENSDTFDSLVSALTRNPGQVGLVGWGAGGGFEQSVLSVPRLGRAVREVRYFGDLDVKGLQIPANADLVAAGENLPRVRPAAGLYEAMFRHARAQACQTPASATTAAALAGWLPEPLRRPAGAHLMGGTRLAQEEVGITELGAGESWRADLR